MDLLLIVTGARGEDSELSFLKWLKWERLSGEVLQDFLTVKKKKDNGDMSVLTRVFVPSTP